MLLGSASTNFIILSAKFFVRRIISSFVIACGPETCKNPKSEFPHPKLLDSNIQRRDAQGQRRAVNRSQSALSHHGRQRFAGWKTRNRFGEIVVSRLAVSREQLPDARQDVPEVPGIQPPRDGIAGKRKLEDDDT